MDRERQAFVAALFAVLLWSTVATGFKLGLAILQPLQLLLLGTLISTVVFVFVATLKRSWKISRRSLIEAACLGTVNPFLYYVVLFEAYKRLPAQIAQPLNYTWAITLAVLAVPVLGQRLGGRTVAGILVSYAGVVVLLMQGEATTLPSVDWLGVALHGALGRILANERALTHQSSKSDGTQFCDCAAARRRRLRTWPGFPSDHMAIDDLRHLGGADRNGRDVSPVATRNASDGTGSQDRPAYLLVALCVSASYRHGSWRADPCHLGFGADDHCPGAHLDWQAELFAERCRGMRRRGLANMVAGCVRPADTNQ